jgi:hypothetical protein
MVQVLTRREVAAKLLRLFNAIWYPTGQGGTGLSTFEVRTPHRGRFSSFLNDRNRLMAWTAENEGAKISLLHPNWSQAVQMVFYSMPLTRAAMTPAPHRMAVAPGPQLASLVVQASSGTEMTRSSSAAYAILVPNRFGDFWRG